MSRPDPNTPQPLQRAERPYDDVVRRVETSSREVLRSAGDLAYRHPLPPSLGAAFVAGSTVASLPILGHDGLLVAAATVAGGVVAHRYITKHSYAHDRDVARQTGATPEPPAL